MRADLTTARGGDAKKLRRHLFSLKRAIKRTFGVQFTYYAIETAEGNGVLHMIWAFDQAQYVYIPQEWLSDRWERIHGAPVVFIRRMKVTKEDVKRVARYLTLQYLAGQSKYIRSSWSWWDLSVPLERGWWTLLRICKSLNIPFKAILEYWGSLLDWGICIIGDQVLIARDRQLQVFSGWAKAYTVTGA